MRIVRPHLRLAGEMIGEVDIGCAQTRACLPCLAHLKPGEKLLAYIEMLSSRPDSTMKTFGNIDKEPVVNVGNPQSTWIPYPMDLPHMS